MPKDDEIVKILKELKSCSYTFDGRKIEIKDIIAGYVSIWTNLSCGQQKNLKELLLQTSKLECAKQRVLNIGTAIRQGNTILQIAIEKAIEEEEHSPEREFRKLIGFLIKKCDCSPFSKNITCSYNSFNTLISNSNLLDFILSLAGEEQAELWREEATRVKKEQEERLEKQRQDEMKLKREEERLERFIKRTQNKGLKYKTERDNEIFSEAVEVTGRSDRTLRRAVQSRGGKVTSHHNNGHTTTAAELQQNLLATARTTTSPEERCRPPLQRTQSPEERYRPPLQRTQRQSQFIKQDSNFNLRMAASLS